MSTPSQTRRCESWPPELAERDRITAIGDAIYARRAADPSSTSRAELIDFVNSGIAAQERLYPKYADHIAVLLILTPRRVPIELYAPLLTKGQKLIRTLRSIMTAGVVLTEIGQQLRLDFAADEAAFNTALEDVREWVQGNEFCRSDLLLWPPHSRVNAWRSMGFHGWLRYVYDARGVPIQATWSRYEP